MEASVSGGTYRFYEPGPSNLDGNGRKGREWDLNDWHWDGDLFIATPVNAVPSDCRNKQLFHVPNNIGLPTGSTYCSDDGNHALNVKGKGEMEKRRRIVSVEDNEKEAGSLTLNLGGHAYPIIEEDLLHGDGNSNNKRSKIHTGNSNRAMCQVEGCVADLSGAKDYHRRHKVCEMHAKASKALVGNAIQRFCQQCSRFHLLKEFDEGKRSCRRRLAGHNRRRRKTHPDATVSESPLTDDQSSAYILKSLIMTLFNPQSKNTEQLKDQDLLSQFLRNLASLAGSFDTRNLSALLRASQDSQKIESPLGTTSEAAQTILSNGVNAQQSSRHSPSISKTNGVMEVPDSAARPSNTEPTYLALPSVEVSRKRNISECSPDSTVARDEPIVKRVGLKNFDLNDVYNEECGEKSTKIGNPVNHNTNSLNCPSWMPQESHHSSSPQQFSGNSDSASAQSLISSNGNGQGRTDRIVFKLFGKGPNDFPPFIRAQVLEWLSNSPTDIESYIRPGCVILTIYLHLSEAMWEKLCDNRSSNLRWLLDLDGNKFWRTGLMYIRVQRQITFAYNGHLLPNIPLLGSKSHNAMLNVTPIAVSVSATVNFTIKAFNFEWSSLRLLCAFEGKYLQQETPPSLISNSDEHCFSVSCSIPNSIGRGFVEVEDQDLNNVFFPFVVAEPEVCSEIRTLESNINTQYNINKKSSGVKARSEELDFLHEIGWLLHRCQLKSRLKDIEYHVNTFPLKRFKWLIDFSIERHWCAVVNKLLSIILGGSLNLGSDSVQSALTEMALLHKAVEKNSRSIVELLLRYVPDEYLRKSGSQTAQVGRGFRSFLFRPDMLDHEGRTPLHIVATIADAETVLDALTNDPGQVGIVAWKTAHDGDKNTPEDFARLNGFNSYLDLVEKKIAQKSGAGHVVLDVPATLPASDSPQKELNTPSHDEPAGFEIERGKLSHRRQNCTACGQQQLAYAYRNRSRLAYRPLMLSMVGIAAVCVCVGLLLKGLPEVHYVRSPFRWEYVPFGSI